MANNIQARLAVNCFVLFLLLRILSSADEASSRNTLSTAPDTDRILVLDQLQAEALRANARLQAMRAKWEAMQERPSQAGALPNPMFTYRGMDVTRSGSFPDTNEKRFELEQSFPWFGKRDLRGKIAEKDAEAMKSEYDAMAREVIMMVKETYYGLYAVQKSISITKGEENLLKQIVKITETKYATGESSQQDVLKAQSEITMVNQRLLELEARETTLKARLNMLLNHKQDSPLGNALEGPPTEIDNDLQKLLDLAEKNRPEISGAQTQIERSKAERKLMAKEYFPDLKLGGEYRSFNDGSDDLAMFMVGMEIPIWQGKYRAGTREATKTIDSDKAALETVQKQTAFDVKDSHFKLLTANKTIDLYRNTLVPQAEMRFKASDAAYRTGKADFMDLLESERFLLNAKVMLAMAEGDLGMNLARLERAIGTDLKVSPKQSEVQNAK
jgi:outer membrane protein, heavy metal efflux system